MSAERVDRQRFFGRETEIAAVTRSIATAPFTLLLGPGGAGKTRLARLIAERHRELAPVFCDLSNATARSDVIGALAAALQLQLGGASGDAAEEQLGLALGARAGQLVILDNLETIGDGAELVQQLIDIGPRFLGTSRTTGPFTDAEVIEVGPLRSSDARELFIDRARFVAPEFEADGATDALLDKLDGSPLAIEIAAARSHVLSPAALLDRFARHLDWPSPGERPSRHKSLRAVVEGSWQLCSDDDRRALACASLFRGDFEIDAAEAVIGEDAADRLASLLSSSLVMRVTSEGDTRFSLSESVREIAAERLADDPEAAQRARERHADHYRALAVELSERAQNGEPPALRALSAETENLLASFRLDGRAALAYDILFQRAVPVDVHIALLAEARARMASRAPEDRAELELAMAHAVRRSGRARDTLAQAVVAEDLARGVASPRLLAGALLIKAAGHYDAGKLRDAGITAAQAVAVAESCDMVSVAARAWAIVGFSAMENGDLIAANRSAERSAAIAREHNLTLVEFNAENLFGAVQARRGELTAAQDHFRRALRIIEGLGLTQQEALGLGNLGKTQMIAGDYAPAGEALEAALRQSRKAGLRRLEIVHSTSLAKLAAAQGNLADAGSRAGVAAALAQRIDSRAAEPIALLLGTIAMIEGRFEDALTAFDRAIALGLQLEGANRAAAHAGRAAALALGGRFDEAKLALDEARASAVAADSIDVSVVAAHAAIVSFAEGDRVAGLAALALTERRAPTSVDVRLARQVALALARESAPRKTQSQPPARGEFEIVSRNGTAAGTALPRDADLAFDAITRSVVVDGQRQVDLRKKPLAAKLLEVVLSDPGKAFDKAQLFREVWQTEFRDSAQTASLYKAVDRLAHLLDEDARRFFRWDESGALVVVAKHPALLRARGRG